MQMMRMTNSSQILRAPQRNNSKKAIRFGPPDSFRNLNISGHPLRFPSSSPKPSNRTPNRQAMRNISPPHLCNFQSVFSKESFDDLPESKLWDHAVELVADATPKSCKVYPLATSEQSELDAFLKENLESCQIRPSKLPMASPVFFIKKKDSRLHLVQDYCTLDAMTVKNKYPLPLIPELIAKLWGAKYFTKLEYQKSRRRL
jgi:hypothetical protein